jgi:hypothetical protein
LSTIKVQSLSNKLVEVAVIAAVLVVFLIAMQFAYGQSAGSLENQTNRTIVNESNVTDYTQTDQDKLNAIDNSTHSLVKACSSLGEADTSHMILCNNLIETIHKQCQVASFIFCTTDVFGPRS